MVLNTAQFTDNLMSAPAVCGYVLLVLFFTGELVTHLLGPAPSANHGRPRRMAMYAVTSSGADRWTSHHVAVLEPSDRHETVEFLRDWPRIVSHSEQAPDPVVESDHDQDEAADRQRQDFTRWLIERGRLGEWESDGEQRLKPLP
jgi:hypothetical protein